MLYEYSNLLLVVPLFLLIIFVLPHVPQGFETASLFGKPLERPQLDDSLLKDFESKLNVALSEFDQDPYSIDKCIWVGRMLGYLGSYRDAILWYTSALKSFGPAAKILRHRGHRYITLRCFAEAVADLQLASKLISDEPDEVEIDGIPNALGLPISSLHSNVWYHLGLAFYLEGDFTNALMACNAGIEVSDNPDKFVSQSYWKYLTLLQLGDNHACEKLLGNLEGSYDLVENFTYYQLLNVFNGTLEIEEIAIEASNDLEYSTLYYGFGMYFLLHNQPDQAIESFRSVVAGPIWQSFGYIAAETELKRLGYRP